MTQEYIESLLTQTVKPCRSYILIFRMPDGRQQQSRATPSRDPATASSDTVEHQRVDVGGTASGKPLAAGAAQGACTDEVIFDREESTLLIGWNLPQRVECSHRCNPPDGVDPV